MRGWLQECPKCGYVAADLSQGDEQDRLFVRTAKYAALRETHQSSSISSRFLIRAALDAARDDPGRAFTNTLCAAWDADDRGLEELAKSLRRTASGLLAGRSPRSIDSQLQLLDVLRRAADWAGATALAEAIMQQHLEHPYSAVVSFQLGKINSTDDGCYKISEALASAHVS